MCNNLGQMDLESAMPKASINTSSVKVTLTCTWYHTESNICNRTVSVLARLWDLDNHCFFLCSSRVGHLLFEIAFLCTCKVFPHPQHKAKFQGKLIQRIFWEYSFCWSEPTWSCSSSVPLAKKKPLWLLTMSPSFSGIWATLGNDR